MSGRILAAAVIALAIATAFLAPARAEDSHGALRDGQVFRDCDEGCPDMVVMPPGAFVMGSPTSEPGRADNEGPQHRVAIGRFAAGRVDVTRAQWTVFVLATHRADRACNAYPGPGGSWRDPGFTQTPSEPVVCVSWSDAQDYARWLTQRTSHMYRLMTEEEWEYAARAGTATPFGWGDLAGRDRANYGADICCSGLASGRDRWIRTSPGGAFPPNAFGLYDMAGNVWQWTSTCYTPAYDAPAATAPCSAHVIRGGSWLYPPGLMRAAVRRSHATPGVSVGFRVARDL